MCLRGRRVGTTILAALVVCGCGIGDVEGKAVDMATEYAREDAEQARESVEEIFDDPAYYDSTEQLAEKAETAISGNGGEVFDRSIEGSTVRVAADFVEKANYGGGLTYADARVRLCVRYKAAGGRVRATDVHCPPGLTPIADVTITPQPDRAR